MNGMGLTCGCHSMLKSILKRGHRGRSEGRQCKGENEVWEARQAKCTPSDISPTTKNASFSTGWVMVGVFGPGGQLKKNNPDLCENSTQGSAWLAFNVRLQNESLVFETTLVAKSDIFGLIHNAEYLRDICTWRLCSATMKPDDLEQKWIKSLIMSCWCDTGVCTADSSVVELVWFNAVWYGVQCSVVELVGRLLKGLMPVWLTKWGEASRWHQIDFLFHSALNILLHVISKLKWPDIHFLSNFPLWNRSPNC